MEVNFPDSFFVAEEREGYFVSEMMKRAWAAQLVVLSEIDKVCKKHGIKWFVDSGTLLGAVRHKGFIPWDDDVDIAMLRPDYNKFITVAAKDLPEGYMCLNIHNFPEYTDFLTRVVNHYYEYPAKKETLDKYYGFPFVCGVDVTPLDYIPKDPGQLTVFNSLVDLLGVGANICSLPDADPSAVNNILDKVKEFTGVEIDRKKDIPNQLRILLERISGTYTHRDADRVGLAIRQKDSPDYNWPKHTYFKQQEVEFEGIMLPAPLDLDEHCRIQWGDDYMTPRQVQYHDFPFYRREMESYGLEVS